ncbi:DUF169 domain-containing protein [Desulfopila aestuarii]|uniref:Uncharacterized conserved protein, DUF169 family n=1 Tax=Desulfopila aestuarii DSM 18488 TaxID=1121416 RepID=A0A1M7Y5Z2_9BACT|nr:DUF169 domain-containing protein [Desulfopila aestuarii]SHO48081.1 Uncharacterized conserved protein, DUF169 family [Desulfopila aestuarii DSM 18488]
MDASITQKIPKFLETLHLAEEPVGLFYTDTAPETSLKPPLMEPPTPEREQKGEINWQNVFGSFSCVMGLIWRARKKKGVACFSADRPGCPGGSFFLGFHKPQTETILNYVTTGIPGWSEGEHYCESPDALRAIFATLDPRPATGKFCVVKPLSLFADDEDPAVVIFFSRPEPLCGLHQFATYVTNDPESVMSPWSAACGSIAAWPMHYTARKLNKAVLGGWDPSARKFFPPDELSFAVPYSMFMTMLERYEQSFLTTDTWAKVVKKAARSDKTWNRVKG